MLALMISQSLISGHTASVDMSIDAANLPPQAAFTTIARVESRRLLWSIFCI